MLTTDRMLNTCSNELHRGSRSGEVDLEVGGAQDEWNLYQGRCPSVNCGSTSFKTDDNILSAAFEFDRSSGRVCCKRADGYWSIEDVGSEVKHLVPGDRVALEAGISCWQCEPCKQGSNNSIQEGIMQTRDEETRKFFKHSIVHCVLAPRYASHKLSWFKQRVVGTLYTHHQKLVIVDT